MYNPVTLIDPGTTKLAVLICRKGFNGGLELLGLGRAQYDGVQNDGWKSENITGQALDSALGQARKMAGIRISRCILGIPNEFCGLIRNEAELPLGRPVSKQDVMELRRRAAEYSLPAPWEVANVVYGTFSVDGRSVGNPLGISCEKLGLQASLICIETDFADQMTRFLRSRQIEVSKWVPVPLACGEAMLTQEDRHKGIIWVDTGGQSTDIAVYKNGIPVFYDWLPLGGDDISRDIAIGIDISIDEAERLKRYCVLGLAFDDDSEDSAMQMPIRDGQHIQNIPMGFLQEIVESRIEEILELVVKRVEAEGLLADSQRVVLTGGGLSLFRGIRELGSRILGLPVYLGVPDVIGLSSPTLSSVYSIGCYGIKDKPYAGWSLSGIWGTLRRKLINKIKI